MPILLYFVVVGSTLFGLLLGVDAMLPPVSPAIVSSNFYGLPPPLRAAPEVGDRAVAPAPDMSSPQVLAAMPKEPVASVAQIAARAAAQAPETCGTKTAAAGPAYRASLESRLEPRLEPGCSHRRLEPEPSRAGAITTPAICQRSATAAAQSG